MSRRRVWKAAVPLLATAALAASLFPPAPAIGQTPYTFTETFDGMPAAPQPWNPSNWDVTVHSRDSQTWTALDTMEFVRHGTDCAAPPATHQTTGSYDDAVFLCHDHVMTAIKAGGYGLIELTPAARVDISAGEAVISWDMSTERLEHSRDWVSINVSPVDNHLQLEAGQFVPDLSGEPLNDVGFSMTQSNNGMGFDAWVLRDGIGETLTSDQWTDITTILTPSATRRDRFELRLSKTHVKFGMPAGQPAVNNGNGFWWVDQDFSGAPIAWDLGVVQFGHHSYNPTKYCPNEQQSDTCGPTTWHWDNVSISPAVPFQMVKGDRRVTGEISGSPYNTGPIVFTEPAPANSYLRFDAMGDNPRFSVDDGATWTSAHLQEGTNSATRDGGTFRSFFTPIPAGTTSVLVAADTGWWGNHWLVRDPSIWALDAPIPTATPTATPTPTAEATFTSTPVPTDTPTPVATDTPTTAPTATATATVIASATATPTATPSPPTATPDADPVNLRTRVAVLETRVAGAAAALGG